MYPIKYLGSGRQATFQMGNVIRKFSSKHVILFFEAMEVFVILPEHEHLLYYSHYYING